MEVLKNLRNVDFKVKRNYPGLQPIEMPLASNILTEIDPLALNFLYSEPHRKLISSPEFGKLCVPFLEKIIFDETLGNTYVNVDCEALYAPIMDALFEIHAPMEYETLKKVLRISKNDNILEMGSATGNLAVRVANDAKYVVGIDMSASYTKFAKEKAHKLGIGNCNFIENEYPCTIGNDFKYFLSFGVNNHQTYSNFVNSKIPADEALIGGFRVNLAIDKTEQDRREKSLTKLREKYRVVSFTDHADKLGDKIEMDFIYLKQK